MRLWLVVPWLALATAASAQLRPDSGTFVTTLGRDTIAAEHFVLRGNRLEVIGFTRVPQTRRLHLIAELDDAGRVLNYQLVNERPEGQEGPGAIRTRAEYLGDSVRFAVMQGNNTPRVRTVPGRPEYLPLINPLYSTLAIALRAARTRGDSILTLQGQQGPLVYRLEQLGGDSVALMQPGGMLRARFDGDGTLVWMDGSGTTFKVEVRRAEGVDVAALTQSFGKRDSGAPLGQLSPRDTIRATFSGATLSVDYGRPAARGRKIFGDVVPYGKVWRTGANAATQLDVTRDVLIGDAVVPAGKYTLWTIPDRNNRWILIVNRQTGQWGTVYDELQDLVRIPMRVESVAQPVERLTVEVVPSGVGASIILSWDRARAIVPVRVR